MNMIGNSLLYKQFGSQEKHGKGKQLREDLQIDLEGQCDKLMRQHVGD